MKLIFQGDSITDGGRDRRNYFQMGNSYPKYVSELLKQEFPEATLELINLGISGNRTCQLFDRLYSDAIALEPDVISILIGINDIWHRHDVEHIETTNEQIAVNYRAILTRLRKQTHAKIVILSPYILDCDDKEDMRAELLEILPIIRKLAEEFADVYVPLDLLFEEALKKQPEKKHYSRDGVHPNQNGARFIAEQFFQATVGLFRDILS